MAKGHDDDEGGGDSKRSKSEVVVVKGSEGVWSFAAGTSVQYALSKIASQEHGRLAILGEKDGSAWILGEDEQIMEGFRYFLFRVGRKPKAEVKALRMFGAGAAVNREQFYFIEPDVDQLVQDLKDGRYSVLCGRRQSGKTTAAMVAVERLRGEGDLCPILLEGMEMQAKRFGLSEMWEYFWDCLHRACPSLFKKRPDTQRPCLSMDFRSLFEKEALEVPVALILDEADSLLLLSTDCLDDFFHTIRTIKQHRSFYNLRSFALVGVETVKVLLEARYDERVKGAEGDCIPSSTHSCLSPFPHDHTLHPAEFDVADIKDLMDQANGDHFGVLHDVPEIAASIMEQTAGHKGLVVTCLSFLMREHAYDYKAWLELADSYKLGSYVFGQATYNRLLRCFKHRVSASQEDFNLLAGFLENGEQEYQESDLVTVRGLLAEGVLAVKGRNTGTCIVDISSPLLRTAIMRKCLIVDQMVEPPPTTTVVDRKWVVLQAITTLDGDLMGRPECLNADGQSSSEYIHQFLFMCRVKTVLRQAYPHLQIFVLPEVKEQQFPGKKRSQLRLDTLVRDGPNCARMGFELMVNASLKSAECHEERARQYHHQHNVQVFMINFSKDKGPVLVRPKSDGVYSMSVEFNSAENAALVRTLDVQGRLEEDRLQLTKWTGRLSFTELVSYDDWHSLMYPTVQVLAYASTNNTQPEDAKDADKTLAQSTQME